MELSIVLSQLVQALDITIVARTMPRPVGTWSIARPAASSCGDVQIWRRRRSIQPMAQPLRHWSSAGGTEGRWWRFRCRVSTERCRGGRGTQRTSMPDLVSPGRSGRRTALQLHTGGAVVGPSTEVWLDFTVRPDGTALAVALVPFVVPPGGISIVIHAMARMPNGMAGARLACLPLQLLNIASDACRGGRRAGFRCERGQHWVDESGQALIQSAAAEPVDLDTHDHRGTRRWPLPIIP